MRNPACLNHEVRCGICAAMVLLFMLAGCRRFQISSQGTSSLNRKLLFDWREPRPPQSPEAPQTASKAELKLLYAALFPQGFSTRNGCPPSDTEPEHQPRVLGTATGAFTTPGSVQTAYLVDTGSCGSEGTGENRLAIFSGGRLQASTPVEANQLLRTFDLDHNGRREILLATAREQNGISVEIAELVQFEKDQFKVEESFGRVRYDTCRSNQPESAITALRIEYFPEIDLKTGAEVNKIPRFNAEVYRSPCPLPGQSLRWVRVEGSVSGNQSGSE